MYPQLSPQIINSNQKGRFPLQIDSFNDQSQENRNSITGQQTTFGQAMNSEMIQSDSLSKPAIINQYSNTKSGQQNSRSNFANQSPNKAILGGFQPQFVRDQSMEYEEEQQNQQVFVQENPDDSFEQSSKASYNQDEQEEEQTVQEDETSKYHQRNPSGQSALRTTLNYALSQSNQETFLQEVEGLDLTEGNDGDENLNFSNNFNFAQQSDHNNLNLSTINEMCRDNSHLISDHKQFNFQQENEPNYQLQDLEQVEAELEAEVNQLDLIYEHHIKNQPNRQGIAEYNLQDYDRSEIVHQQAFSNEYVDNYHSSLDKIQEEIDESSSHMHTLGNYTNAEVQAMQLAHQQFLQMSERRQNQEQEIVRQSEQNSAYIKSMSIKQYDEQMRNNQDQSLINEEMGGDEESSSRDQQNVYSSSDNLVFNSDLNLGLFQQLTDQISQFTVYKQICEQRIRELQPGHPLPIQIEHLGQPNHAMIQYHQNQVNKMVYIHNQEKQLLVDKIEEMRQQPNFDIGLQSTQNQTNLGSEFKIHQLGSISSQQHPQASSSIGDYSLQLNQQFNSMKCSFDLIKKEKAELEMALRKETQCNQEMSLKLQILKDQVEKKFMNEVSSNKTQLINYHSQDGKPSIGGTMNNTMRDALLSTQKMSAQSQQHEVSHFVDQMVQIGMLEQSNSNLRNEISKLNSALSTTQKMNKFNLKKQSKYETQLNSISSQGTGVSIEQVAQKTQALEHEVDLKNSDIQFYKQAIENLQTQIQTLQNSHRDKGTFQSEVEGMRRVIESKNKEISKKKIEIVELKQKSSNLEQQLDEVDKMRESMQHSLKSGLERVSQYRDQVVSESNQTMNLQKQLDSLNLKVSQLTQEKVLTKNEKEVHKKQHSIEIESLRKLLEQNQKHLRDKELASFDQSQKMKEHMSKSMNQTEIQNIQQSQQISQHNHSIAQLETKLYAADLEKTHYASVQSQNIEFEKNIALLKQQIEQFQDQVNKQKTQVQTVEKKHMTISKKNEIQQQQIENTKKQNVWLKEEREQICKTNQEHKTKFEQEMLIKQDTIHQLELLRSKMKLDSEASSLQIEQLNMDNQQLRTEVFTNSSEIKMLKTQAHLSSQHTTDRDSILTHKEKENQTLRHENTYLLNQVDELKQENSSLFKNDERTKRLLVEIDRVKELNLNLEKENQFNSKKIQALKLDQDKTESDNRVLKRDLQEIKDSNKLLDYQKKNKEQQILDQMAENNNLSIVNNEKTTQLQSLTSQQTLQHQKFEDIGTQLKRTNQYNEDLKQQLNKQIHRNNDNCLKFQKDQVSLEGVRLQMTNVHQKVIKPFAQSLLQQFQASEILRECLVHGPTFDPLGEEDNFASGQDTTVHSQMFTDAIKRFTTLNILDMEGNKELISALKCTQTDYIQFLQQEVVDKLIGSLVESRSRHILQERRQGQLNAKIISVQGQCQEKDETIESLTQLLEDVRQTHAKAEKENASNKTQSALSRQQIHNLTNQIKNFQQQDKQKQNQMNELMEENASCNHLYNKNQGKLHDFEILEGKLNFSNLEKTYLWKVLKGMKAFLKTDMNFKPLELMLNEYVVLLEQLVILTQNKNTNYHTLKITDQQSIDDLAAKLKLVEQDIRQFRLPNSDQQFDQQHETMLGSTFNQEVSQADHQQFASNFLSKGTSKTQRPIRQAPNHMTYNSTQPASLLVQNLQNREDGSLNRLRSFQATLLKPYSTNR